MAGLNIADISTCPRNLRSKRKRTLSLTEEEVPLPAMFVECGRSSKPSPIINFGSEPESDDDEDEIVAPAMPRVLKVLMETPEDDEPLPLQQSSSPPSSPMSLLGEFSDSLDFNWRPLPNPPVPSNMRRKVFSESNVGPTAPKSDPYEIFLQMWDRRIMDHIASETNKYAQQLAEQLMENRSLQPSSRIRDWKDTSADELYVFFAIIVAMGMVAKGRVVDYWSASASIFMTPGFRVYMPLRRFQLICKCLHFRDNKDMDTRNLDRSEAKLFKIQPIIDHLNSAFQLLYNLQQNIVLDESLLQWKGWLDINQFIPNRTTVGIKAYEIYESQTGYLWRFVVSAHKTAAPQSLQEFVPDLVLDLLQGLEKKGHTVWMDSFYNSPALARKLKTLGFDCVGTLRTNRQFVPPELTDLSKRKLRPGQIAGLTSGDVDLMVWRDRNRVAMISTYHGNGVVTTKGGIKPALIYDYNRVVGGVDKKDQMLAAFPTERKRTKVWYKKLFRRLLNVSILNSYIICKHSNPVVTHRAFRMSLVESLLKHHSPHVPVVPVDLPQPRRGMGFEVREHHLIEFDFEPNGKARKRRRCVACKKRVTTVCRGCDKAACMNPCFVSIH